MNSPAGASNQEKVQEGNEVGVEKERERGGKDDEVAASAGGRDAVVADWL